MEKNLKKNVYMCVCVYIYTELYTYVCIYIYTLNYICIYICCTPEINKTL